MWEQSEKMLKRCPFLLACWLLVALISAPKAQAFHYSGSIHEINHSLEKYIQIWDVKEPGRPVGHGILFHRNRTNLAEAIHLFLVDYSQNHPLQNLPSSLIQKFLYHMVAYIGSTSIEYDGVTSTQYWSIILDEFGSELLAAIIDEQQAVNTLVNQVAAAVQTQQQQLSHQNELLNLNNHELAAQLIGMAQQLEAAGATIAVTQREQQLTRNQREAARRELIAANREKREAKNKIKANQQELEKLKAAKQKVEHRLANEKALNRELSSQVSRSNDPGNSHKKPPGHDKKTPPPRTSGQMHEQQNAQPAAPQIRRRNTRFNKKPADQGVILPVAAAVGGNLWKIPKSLKKFVKRHPFASAITGLTVAYATYKASTILYNWYVSKYSCLGIQNLTIKKICSFTGVFSNPDAVSFLKYWDKKYSYEINGYNMIASKEESKFAKTGFKYAICPGLLYLNGTQNPDTIAYTNYVKFVLSTPKVQANLDEKKFRKKLAHNLTRTLNYCGYFTPSRIFKDGIVYYQRCARLYVGKPGSNERNRPIRIAAEILREHNKFIAGIQDLPVLLDGADFFAIRNVILLNNDKSEMETTADAIVTTFYQSQKYDEPTSERVIQINPPVQGHFPLMTISGLNPNTRYRLTSSWLDSDSPGQQMLEIKNRDSQYGSNMIANDDGEITFFRPEQSVFRLEEYLPDEMGMYIPNPEHSATIPNVLFVVGEAVSDESTSHERHKVLYTFMGPENIYVVRIIVHDVDYKKMLPHS